MKIREKISAIYWDAVSILGPLVPTPQVIGAGLAAAVLGLLDRYAVDLSVVGISPAVIVGGISLGVAYLIGPERRPLQIIHQDEGVDRFVPSVGQSDRLPEVDGEFVGPEDDSSAPGTGLT